MFPRLQYGLVLVLLSVSSFIFTRASASIYTCSDPVISPSDWESLQKTLGGAGGGDVFLPGSPGYTSRVAHHWVEAQKRSPLAVVSPETAEGVAAAVVFARKHQACVTVKSSGHSYIANSFLSGFIGIDVSMMNKTAFDPSTNQMVVQPAVTLLQSVRLAEQHGVFGAWGDCADVALGGYLTGGGEGTATSLVGLAVDSVLSYTVVIANGSIVTANATENSDLFWGLRGGHGPGNNFGIVVEATVQMHVPPANGNIVAWTVTSPRSAAGTNAFVRHFFDLVLSKAWPDELYTLLNIPFGPLSSVSASGYFFGTVEDAKSAVASLSSFPGTSMTYSSMSLWESAKQLFAQWGSVPHHQFIEHSGHAVALSHSTVDTVLNMTSSVPASLVNGANGMYWTRTGGVTNRVAADATAYPGRGYEATLEIVALNDTASQTWADEASAFASSLYAAIMPDLRAADPTGENKLQVYANYPDLELVDPLDAYYRHNLPRLQGLKAKYDPDVFFQFPQHIIPATA